MPPAFLPTGFFHLTPLPAVPGSSELEEAKRLIEDFCLDEYEQDSVDFGNLAKVPLAYGVTDSGGLEVQVNVDLIHFSLAYPRTRRQKTD